MIEQFRRASESWVAKGLFLFMAVAFVVMWGGGDLAQQIGTHNQTVATVGNVKITSTEFADAFNHHVREIQARVGQLIDEKQARAIGLFEIVRERLIQEALLGSEAKRLNIYVSDQYIKDRIKQDKIFQENGKFSHDRFKIMIAKIDYTEKTYIEFLRRELIRERLITALTSAVDIAKPMVMPLYLWQKEQRQINTVTIDSQKIVIREKPSAETLQVFFDDHVAEFKAPEYRDFSVLTFSTDDIRQKIVVNDNDIDAEFYNQKENLAHRKLVDVKNQLIDDIKNQRLSHAVQNLITNVEDAIGAGHSVAEIADKYGLALKTFRAIDRGGLYDPFNPELPSDNTKNGLSEEVFASVLSDAFKNDLNSIGSIIEASQGRYFVTEVTAISPEITRTFDQVKHKIINYWLQFQQMTQAQKQAKIVTEEIRAGGSFNAIAGKYNLSAISARITRSGIMAPSILKIDTNGIGLLYQAPKGEPVSFVSEQDDKGIKIIVGVVKSIERSKDKIDTAELQNTAATLKQLYINDIINQYLMMLRNKYPVEINEQYFKKIDKNN